MLKQVDTEIPQIFFPTYELNYCHAIGSLRRILFLPMIPQKELLISSRVT